MTHSREVGARRVVLAAGAAAHVFTACGPPGPSVSLPTPEASAPDAVGVCVASGAMWADPPDAVPLPSDRLRPLNVREAFPRYPTELRTAGIEGAVVVTFLVDTTGRVDAASARVTASTNVRFSASVCEAVPRLRYRRADGQPFRAPVRTSMPFTFTITG